MDADFYTFQSMINDQQEQDTFARFYDRSVKTEQVNPKTGLPIFKDVCYVEIRIKNNNTDIYNQPATPEKIQRFPREYNMYLTSKKCAEEGTPLENFSFLSGAQADTLKCCGIHTVEALGSLTEQQAEDLDMRAEREAAVRFLAAAKQNLTLVEWQKKVEALEAEIARLTAELALARKKEKSTPEKEVPSIAVSAEDRAETAPKTAKRKKKK